MENNNYNKSEIENIIRKRERTKLSRKYYELESEEAGVSSKIFWGFVTFLIVNPAIIVGTSYYFYNSIDNITNFRQFVELWNNAKWAAIGITCFLVINSLSLYVITFESYHQ